MSSDRPAALVTGGARRVGAAICKRLVSDGFDVALTFKSSADEASALADQLQTKGSRVIAIQSDLADVHAFEAIRDQLATEFDRLDVLVHNASMYESTPFGSIGADEASLQYRVNALAPLLLTQSLHEKLAASSLNGGGCVLCMCDMHALGRPRKGFSAYSMSKAALAEMVRSLARDLAPDIRVNGIAPGVIAFPESGYESGEELQQAYLSRVPLGRSGAPDDAAEVVSWLATKATYITGEIIRLDGGRWLA